MGNSFSFPEGDETLPPEVHLKMALDYLHLKARKLNLAMTATLIEAAAVSALQEMKQEQPD